MKILLLKANFVSLDSVYLAEALQSIYTIYELPYYFVGKVCHIGYTENVISTPFEYRKGLVSIKKQTPNIRSLIALLVLEVLTTFLSTIRMMMKKVL